METSLEHLLQIIGAKEVKLELLTAKVANLESQVAALAGTLLKVAQGDPVSPGGSVGELSASPGALAS